jgi:PPP family 3-phenylpropionic acid transporter
MIQEWHENHANGFVFQYICQRVDYLRIPLPFPRKAADAAALKNPLQRSFSRLEFIYMMFMTTQSFVAVYLQSKGLSSASIGKVTATNSLLGIIAPPLWGIVADKLRSSKKAYIICLVAATAFTALVPVAGGLRISGILLLTVILPIIHFFRFPSDSIINSWIIQITKREKGMEYGAIRLWGSVSCGLMATAYYFLIRSFSTDILFILPLVLIVPLVTMAGRLPDSHAPGPVGPDAAQTGTKSAMKEKLKPWRLFKNYYYLSYLMLSFFFSLAGNAIFVFRAFLIKEVGGDPTMIGLIIGLKIFFEVPTMMVSNRMINRFRPTIVLLVIGSIYLSEHFLYTIAASTVQVLLIQMYQGLGNGLNTPTMVNYIYRLAPAELKSTAQSLCAMVNSVAGIIAGLFGGWAVGALGIRSLYRLSSLMLLLALTLFILSFVVGKKLLKLEPPVPLFVKKAGQTPAAD